MYITPQAVIFGPPKYAASLRKICEERDIKVHYKHTLVEIRHEKRERADFQIEDGEILTFPVSPASCVFLYFRTIGKLESNIHVQAF